MIRAFFIKNNAGKDPCSYLITKSDFAVPLNNISVFTHAMPSGTLYGRASLYRRMYSLAWSSETFAS